MTGAILVLLACVFALAGSAKLGAPDAFRATLRKLVPQPIVRPASIVIPGLELALAVMLVSGVAPRLAAAAAIALLLIFTLALVRMWQGGLRGCGCFGEASDSAPAGVARNVLLIIAAMLVVRSPDAVHTYARDLATLVGQLTIVVGTLCCWPVAVAVAQRRNMIFTQGARK